MSNLNINTYGENLGGYFKDLEIYKPLKRDEEKKLLKKYKRLHDINARNILITSNLRYACKLATLYCGRGLSLSELISEANKGLMDSLDKFDIKKDVKLISYAKWWIMQRMQAALEKRGKMPMSELPSDNESQYDDDSDDVSVRCKENYNEKSFLIEDEEHENVDKTEQLLSNLFMSLNERESDIVKMYYGYYYNKEYTLEEIGNKYSMTKERVRKIIGTSFKKLRSKAILIKSQQEIMA